MSNNVETIISQVSFYARIKMHDLNRSKIRCENKHNHATLAGDKSLTIVRHLFFQSS